MVLKATKVGPSWQRMKNVYGNGNNKEDGCEGYITKTSLAATSTVLSCPEMPILTLSLSEHKNKCKKDLSLPAYEEILSLEQPERIR